MKKSKIVLFFTTFVMVLLDYGIEYCQYRLSNQQGSIYLLIFVLLLCYFVLTPFINNIYNKEATQISLKNAFEFENNVMDYLYKAVNNLFYDRKFLTDIFYLRETIVKCSDYYIDLINLIKYMVIYFTYVGILLFVTPEMTLVFIVITAIMLAVRIVYAFKEVDDLIGNVSEDKDAEYYRDVLTDAETMRDIKTYDYGDSIAQKSINAFRKGVEIVYSYRLKNALICPLLSALLYILGGITVIFSVYFAAGNLGEGIVAISCALKTLLAIQPVADTISDVMKKKKRLNRAKKIMQELHMNSEKAKSAFSREGKIIDHVESIRFCNVSFSYDGDNNVIEGLNFEWKRGESVCFLGENGAGKSTFLNLLTGVNKPTAGHIFINGIDMEDINYQSYVKHLAVCSQDFARFKDTLENNIRLGRDAIIVDEEYAKIGVEAKQLIGSDIYEKGVEMSGGQWQKVEILRAFVNMINDNLILFDEPTAASDIYSEVEFFETLKELIKSKDALFITHRVGYAAMADNIYVMSKGKIVESGSEAELMSKDSLYKRMYVKQGGLYV